MPLGLGATRFGDDPGWKLEEERPGQVWGQLCMKGDGRMCKTLDTQEKVADIPCIALHRSYMQSLLPCRLDSSKPCKDDEGNEINNMEDVIICFCHAIKFSIRAEDLRIIEPVLSAFCMSKGCLQELDLCSFAECHKMTDFVITFQDMPFRFLGGLPDLPASLKIFTMCRAEDSDTCPCDFRRSLRLVNNLQEFKLSWMALRQPIPAIDAFRTVTRLHLDGVTAPCSMDTWRQFENLQSLELRGSHGKSEWVDGTSRLARKASPLYFESNTLLPPSLRSIIMTQLEVEHLPESIGYCFGLENLVVTDCNLVDLPSTLPRLQATLGNLSLCGNDLSLAGVRTVLESCPLLAGKSVSLARNPKLATDLAALFGADVNSIPLSGSVITHLLARSEPLLPTPPTPSPPAPLTIDHPPSGTTQLEVGALRKYSFEELVGATDNFHESRLISSEGSFGSVYHGCAGGAQNIAVKVMRGLSLHTQEQLERELAVLHRCRHSHILGLTGYSLDDRIKCLVYEYKERGSLRHILDQSPSALPWKRRLQILAQVASGIEYLHTVVNPPIVHRDVKAANILVDGTFNATLGDFGFARLSPEFDATSAGRSKAAASTRIFGTPGYIDPEYAQSGTLTMSCDIFSLGVVALELLSSSLPHDEQLEPPWILDRFEDACEGEVERFCPQWPAVPAGETATVVTAWVKRRSRLRPDAQAVAAQTTTLVKKWGCSPAQLVQQSESGSVCVVCLEAPASHALIPCGHRCICAAHVAAVLQQRCPLCRAHIEMAAEIFEA